MINPTNRCGHLIMIPGSGPAAAKKLLGVGSGLIDEDEYEGIVQTAYLNKFGNLDEYLLHTKLIGMGHDDPNRYLSALCTYDLENATPSEYLRTKKELEASMNVFGSR